MCGTDRALGTVLLAIVLLADAIVTDIRHKNAVAVLFHKNV